MLIYLAIVKDYN